MLEGKKNSSGDAVHDKHYLYRIGCQVRISAYTQATALFYCQGAGADDVLDPLQCCGTRMFHDRTRYSGTST